MGMYTLHLHWDPLQAAQSYVNSLRGNGAVIEAAHCIPQGCFGPLGTFAPLPLDKPALAQLGLAGPAPAMSLVQVHMDLG